MFRVVEALFVERELLHRPGFRRLQRERNRKTGGFAPRILNDDRTDRSWRRKRYALRGIISSPLDGARPTFLFRSHAGPVMLRVAAQKQSNTSPCVIRRSGTRTTTIKYAAPSWPGS